MRVLIGMGSNIQPEHYLLQAASLLRRLFPDIQFSSVYRSAAVGMEGGEFLNACALFSSNDSLAAIKQQLKALEDLQGRDRSEGSWKPRTLDLDVLIYHEQVVDQELYRYAHAYVPAAELVSIALPQDNGSLTMKVELVL